LKKIKGVVNNIRKPYEKLAAKLLFLDDMEYLNAQTYKRIAKENNRVT
jgi:hypothetical protein